MCGRYTITVSLDEMILRYMLAPSSVPFHIPRYNAAPGQSMPAIIHDGQTNRIGPLQWGLIPSWAKDEKVGYMMINARSETVLEKPAFRNLLPRKRAIIPADGFFEWQKFGKQKQPMRIKLIDQEMFSMAALYDTWQAPDGRKISTFTILTTSSNRFMEPIHDRMPVILKREDEQRWLSRDNTDTSDLLSLLKPYPDEEMTAYPVTSKVGSVHYEEPDCIEEAPGEPIQDSLF